MWFSIIWVFLHSLSNLMCNISNFSTGYFSYVILAMQFIHVFWLISEKKFYFDFDFLYLCFFIPLFLYNKTVLNLVFMALSIIILKNYEKNKVIKSLFWVQLSVFCIFGVLLFWGVIQDDVLFGIKGKVHTLGFFNTNVLAKFLTNTIIIFSVYAASTGIDKIRALFLNLVLFLLTFCIYQASLCRTYLFSSFVYFFSFFSSYSIKISCLFKKLLFFLPILIYSILLISIRFYKTFPIIDLIFSFRISILDEYLSELKLIHYFIGFPIDTEKPFDCAYFYIIFSGGIGALCYFWKKYFIWVNKISMSEFKKFFPYVMFFLISGITESTFSMFELSTILLIRIFSEAGICDGKLQYKQSDILNRLLYI